MENLVEANKEIERLNGIIQNNSSSFKTQENEIKELKVITDSVEGLKSELTKAKETAEQVELNHKELITKYEDGIDELKDELEAKGKKITALMKQKGNPDVVLKDRKVNNVVTVNDVKGIIAKRDTKKK